MTAAAVKRQRPPTDREALAAAIADFAAAKQKVERHKAATHRMWHAMHEAEAAIAKARDGLEGSRAAHGRALADAALADEDDLLPLRDDMTRLAVQSLADNQASLEAVKLARAQQRRELPLLEAAVHDAAAQVEAAKSLMLVPAAAALVDQLQAAVVAMAPLRNAVLSLLTAHEDRAVGRRGRGELEPILDRARSLVWAHSVGEPVAPTGQFAAARAALDDPDADISEFVAPVSRPPPAA